MPKALIEILRTVTVTTDESVEIELDVPQEVLDGGSPELVSWIDEILEKSDDILTPEEKAVYTAVTEADWVVGDEDTDTEYGEAHHIV